VAFIALLAFTTVISFRVDKTTTAREWEPEWNQALATARARCLAQPYPRAGAQQIQHSIAFSVTISCDELLTSAGE
jgi:hypothetical protein